MMVKLLIVFLLLMSIVSCREPKDPVRPNIELLTSGVVTCVNYGGGTTCFAGRHPTSWDGESLPAVPIVFHRPDLQTRVVGPLMICLEDGSCFGDPAVGSIEAAEVLLQPNGYGTSQVSSSWNLLCWLDAAGRPKCWGHHWDPMVRLGAQDLRVFSETYTDISLNNHRICGTNSTGVHCGPLASHATDAPELSFEFEGYEVSCQGELYVCARKVGAPSDVTCWFADPPEVAMRKNDPYGFYPRVVKKGVVEYSCGGKACLNFGDRVECYSHENMDGDRYDLKVKKLSAGNFHFCGVAEENEVVCRDWGNMGASFYEKHRSIEFLSLESWRELLEKKNPRERGLD